MAMVEVDELNNSQILRYEDFEFLRCPICKEYLNRPNIMLYTDPDGLKESYSTCERCFFKIADDDTNQISRLPELNFRAETLVAITPFPCKYYGKGCRERYTWPTLWYHERECMFKIFDCSLFEETGSLYSTGLDIIKKFNENWSNLILYDGVITESFNKNFEQLYLIQRNTDYFVCKVKYDSGVDKVWFNINLLKNKSNTVCYAEFINTNSKQVITLKITTGSEETVFDFNAIKSLLCDNKKIKCRVYLQMPVLKQQLAELLKEIQCPSCWDYMKGRIFVCSNGHSTCDECKKSLENCPMCRDGAFKSNRNLSLENLICQGFFPCKNHQKGCTYISVLDEMNCHMKYCRFNSAEET